VVYGVYLHFKQYFSYIVVVNFIGGENHWSVASHKLYHIMLYRVHFTWTWLELITLVVIGTDCIGSCKSNYNTITTAKAPNSDYIHYQWFVNFPLHTIKYIIKRLAWYEKLSVIRKLFLFIWKTDIVNINKQILMLKIIGQCDVNHIMMLLIKTITAVLKILTFQNDH
jgi:hypothetical protein